MARPVNLELRTTVLNSFKFKNPATRKDIHEYLIQEQGQPRSLESTRQLLVRLIKSHVIKTLPNKTDLGETLYAPVLKLTRTAYFNKRGDELTLKAYIHYVMSDEFSKDMGALRPDIVQGLRSLILHSLGTLNADRYRDKGTTQFLEIDQKSRMEKLKGELSALHLFVSKFLASPVFSPVASDEVAQEMIINCLDEQIIIEEDSFNGG